MYYKWQSYDIRFPRYGAKQTYFFAILEHFLPIHLPNNLKNQNFEKMKKTAGDIIFHKCTTNHDHMLHCFWDTTQNGCNFYFSVWTIFCRFTPLTTQKINIKKKWKKMVGDFIILNVYQKFWSHDVRFLRYGAQQMEERTEKVTYRGGCTT